MTRSFRKPLIVNILVLLSGCGSTYKQTDEFSRPEPGSYIVVNASPDQADRIMTSVQTVLDREPRYGKLVMSHGLEDSKTYSFKFRDSCAAQPTLVAAIQREIAKSTATTAQCLDRRSTSPER